MEAKKSRDWERYVAHKKATASALKAARWDHLNGILQTSLEEKNTKPFYRYIKAQKNDNFGISSLKFNGLMYSDSSSKSEILNKQFQSVFTKKSTTTAPRLFGNKYPSIGNLSITLNAVAICPAAGQIAFQTIFCYLSGRRTNSLKWSEMLFVRLLMNKI